MEVLSFMRFHLLDAARGIAAISVVLFHLYSGNTIFEHFFLFVDFFFVLSGFVLAPAVSKISGAHQIRKFVWNRYVRLFPMAYSALFVVIAIQLTVNLKYRIAGETLSDSIPLDSLTILVSLLFLQVFSVNSQLLLYPLWSLSSEWLANVLASIIYFLPMPKKIIFFVFLGFFLIGISMAVESGLDFQNLTNQIGRGFLGFGLGLLAWKLRDTANLPSKLFSLVIISILAPILALYVHTKSLSISVFLAPLFFSFAVLALYSLETQTDFKPPIEVCRYLGRISYGVYVWHVIATNIVALLCKNLGLKTLEPQMFLGIPRFVVVILLTILCTELALKFVEGPIRRKFHYV